MVVSGPKMGFVYLHVHSNYSFLYGTADVETLVDRAAGAGMDALALTDIDGFYAVVPFERACRERGIRPIFGVELAGTIRGSRACVVLLARNRKGYAELSRMVTRRHLDKGFSLEEELRGLSGNVYVLSDDLRVIESVQDHPNLRVALPVARGRGWDEVRYRLSMLAERLGVKRVAVGEVCFLDREDYFFHRVLTAIRTRSTVGTIPPGELAHPDSFFHAADDVYHVFAHDLEPVENALAVASDCCVELELGRPRFPRFVFRGMDGGGVPSVSELLSSVALRGLRERLSSESEFVEPRRVGESGGGRSTDGNAWIHAAGAEDGMEGCSVDPAEWSRAYEALERELSVVTGRGLEDYFLICWDIVRFARSRGLRSLGRGSAGNSLLSYALGITHVNPLRHNLYFERFLNPERENLPDFDIDFGTDDRDTVLEYIFDRYGGDNVAMIGTFFTFRARGAIREVSRVLGIPEGEIAPILRCIPSFASIEGIEDACALTPAASSLRFDEEPLRSVAAVAKRMGGFPRGMGTHPCGIVISPVPLADLVPLQMGERGYRITQWSMNEVEEAGLVKIDIIGQKGLSVIEEAAAMAEENEGASIRVTVGDCLEDEKTREMMRQGRTEGCFYIESPIMIQLLKQARCDDLEVLTALSSIIRPGVSSYGGKRAYLHRHLGLEPVDFLHPTLREVLGDTYGCLIYQEQVIRIAVAVAGMSYAEADGLRRCMSLKNSGDETMENYRMRFFSGALERGIPRSTVEEIFRQISSFAGYAFCKAHSASFALESFESVYWKAHYPAEFMAAVLSNMGGYYSQGEYVEEARRLGLKILPPCVNRSGVRFHGRGKELRVGLMQVKGLTRETASRIIEGRPYRSLGEFIERVHPSRDEVEALIRCGAFHSLGRTRPELLWELRLILNGAGGEMLSKVPHVPDYDPPSSIALELETLGLAVTGHPLLMFREELNGLSRRRGLVRSTDLSGMAGRRVEIAGWKVTEKATRTSNSGEEMLFVSFSDPWGRFETVFFPGVYRRSAPVLAEGAGPYVVGGRVVSELGVETIEVSDVKLLSQLL